MIRTALIGVSGYAQEYLQNLLRLREKGEIELVAVCINNPDECEEQIAQLKEINCPIYSKAEEMFSSTESIEWCCIPTGIDSHLPLALQAFENACNVLLEKPITARLEDIKKIKQAAKEANRLIMIGYQDIYSPDIHEIKQMLLDQKLGELKSIKVLGMWPRSVSHFERNHWAGKQKVGDSLVLDSPLHNAFGHFINLMCFWAGESFEAPIAIGAEIDQTDIEAYRAIPTSENFDTCSLRLKSKNGVSLYAWITHACKQNINPKIEIQCSSGKIIWELEGYLILAEGKDELRVQTKGVQHTRKVMFDTVVKKLKGEDVFVCTPDEGIAPTYLANLIQDSVSIQDVTKEHCTSEETPHGTQISIKDIESLIMQAHKEGKLFSELGIDWA